MLRHICLRKATFLCKWGGKKPFFIFLENFSFYSLEYVSLPFTAAFPNISSEKTGLWFQGTSMRDAGRIQDQ